VEVGSLRPEAILTTRGIPFASSFPDALSQDTNDLVRFQLIRSLTTDLKLMPIPSLVQKMRFQMIDDIWNSTRYAVPNNVDA
jgi:hypothetical protein